MASAQTTVASSPQLPSSNAVTSSGSLRLRVPAATSSSTETQTTSDVKSKATAATPAAKPSTTAKPTPSSTTPAAAAASPAPTAARTPAAAQSKSAPVATPPPPPPPAASSQPASYLNPSYSQHYPNASYLSPAGTSAAPNPTASSTPLLNRTLPTRSETPPLRTQHPLQTVSLRVEPNGRPFTLDYLDGVKSWALRLHDGEKALTISGVKFLAGEDEESSEEEEDGVKEGEEEEEEDVDIEADVPAKRGRKKGKGRGKGKKKTAAPEKGKAKESPKKPKKVTPSLEDVQVRLNGVQIDIAKGEWYVDLPAGLNVVEMGAKDGMIWKVFAERRQV
jgi:chromatin structure-remodeling complex subunit RSC4